MKTALGVFVPIAFFGAVGAYVWTADVDRTPSAADRAIVRANVVREVPPGARRLGVNLGRKVELVAADQESTEAMRGEETKVTLYWRSIAPLADGHKVFGHLDAPSGARSNLDHHPVYGLHPLSRWRAGQIVRDELWITFSARAPRGEHVLWVGIFSTVTSSRLRVIRPGDATVDADGRVRAAAWELR